MAQRDMSEEREEWPVQVGAPDAGRRIDVVLAERLTFRSRSQHRDLIRSGRVHVYDDWNATGPGRPVTRPAQRVRAGELLVVQLDAPFVGRAAVPDRPVDVLWEDAHLLVVDKPSGVAVHPTRRHPAGSLLECLHRWQRRRGDTDFATPCHRLDRETSGVVVLARSATARRRLGDLFERRHEGDDLHKRYLAVVRVGDTQPPDSMEIDAAIGPDPVSGIPIRRAVVPAGSSGEASDLAQAALTRWRTLELGRRRARIELEPVTGRQHQLRVHTAHVGHPILGDPLYGLDDPSQQKALFLRALQDELYERDLEGLGSRRLALHASSIAFPHPMTGSRIEVRAPTPALFDELMKR